MFDYLSLNRFSVLGAPPQHFRGTSAALQRRFGDLQMYFRELQRDLKGLLDVDACVCPVREGARDIHSGTKTTIYPRKRSTFTREKSPTVS